MRCVTVREPSIVCPSNTKSSRSRVSSGNQASRCRPSAHPWQLWGEATRPSLRSPVVEAFRASAVTQLLVVSDLAASKDWYLDVLDASVYEEYGGTSVVLELADSWVLLVTAGEPTPDKPTVTFAPTRDRDLVNSEIIFRVDDCWGTYRLLRSRGAEFLTEPYDWGGEVRAFFRDPDGHLFEVSERRG